MINESGERRRKIGKRRRPVWEVQIISAAHLLKNTYHDFYLGTATWLWRDHKLQAGEDVSCQFGASSLSSMSTITASASLSSVRAFPVQEQPNRLSNKKRTRQSACS